MSKFDNMITVYDVYETQTKVVIVMEKLEIDLSDALESEEDEYKELRNTNRYRWTKQLIVILKDLKESQIVHRDIKPSNLMINKDGDLVLIDFGSARRVDDLADNSDKSLTPLEKKLKKLEIAGTAAYMSPEIVCEKSYSYESDMWAVGCVIVGIHFDIFLLGGILPLWDTNSKEELFLYGFHNMLNKIYKYFENNPKDLWTNILTTAKSGFMRGIMDGTSTPKGDWKTRAKNGSLGLLKLLDLIFTPVSRRPSPEDLMLPGGYIIGDAVYSLIS